MLPHLLSQAGQAAMKAVLSKAPLLAFDFDGTLAPLVARPDQSKVPLTVARRLQRLQCRLPVAIVTGRAVRDVSSRLPFQPHFIVGNHGAEDPRLQAATGGLQRTLDPLRERLRINARQLAEAGVTVEDKGLSLALHYRCSPDQARALSLITTLLRRQGEDTRIFGGKRVVNVAPSGAPDKADAVLRLQADAQARCVVYMGDDVNDEVVFERAPPGWLTVRIGREPLGTKARFVLESPFEVGIALHHMLQVLGEHRWNH